MTKRMQLALIMVFACILISCGTREIRKDMTTQPSNEYRESPISETQGSETVANSNRAAVNKSRSVGGKFNFDGCWIGEKGGGLRLEKSHITHFDESKGSEYRFVVVDVAENDSTDDTALIEIIGLPKFEFLKRYVSIQAQPRDETLNTNKILLRGYESYQDYIGSRFETSEFFYAVDCKVLSF